jgi:hypothetical protein
LAWETHETRAFDEWFDALSEEDQIQVIAAQTYLDDVGPNSGFCTRSTIAGGVSCY